LVLKTFNAASIMIFSRSVLSMTGWLSAID
jgi:hypothetical protein